MEEKTASVWGPDPHVMYSTAQPKSNCDVTSHPTHHTYCSLLLGTTCVQCLYTVVYKSNQVDRIYISITMGKVDGCRLWSPRLTGGRVYPDYPCPHRELINVHVSTRRSTPFSYCSRTQAIDPLHPGLWEQFHRQTKEKDILGLSLNYRMTRPYAHVLLIVTTAQTTVYFTRVYHREEKVWLQFHTICCKYLLSPFVLCFHLGSRICLRGRKSTLKSMGSSKNGRL